MKRPRIIPSLLLNEEKLEKTQGFKDPIYLGDPFIAVRIFNDLEVDELIIIDYTTQEPNYKFLYDLASEAFMPLVYGGGITKTEQVGKIIKSGFEKVSINRLNFINPSEVATMVKTFGSSTLIASIDIKKNFLGKYSIYSKSDKKPKYSDLKEYCQYLEDLGYGEILLTIIDKEASFSGPDYSITEEICDSINIPLLYQGGIGSKSDILNMFTRTKISGVVCGGYFVLNGKLRTPLISYLPPTEIDEISIIINSI